MLFVFEDNKRELYDSPDTYVLSCHKQTIDWGTELKIYPVYKKGCSVLQGYQTIQATFYHEGASSTLDGIYWITKHKPSNNKNWYDLIKHDDKVSVIETGKIVKFVLGDKYPKYFSSSEDLAWFIQHIYPLTELQINDIYHL